jgi:hypothetical protein
VKTENAGEGYHHFFIYISSEGSGGMGIVSDSFFSKGETTVRFVFLDVVSLLGAVGGKLRQH